MTAALAGKSILLIAPKTFGYEEEIRAALERLGAIVTYRSDKPSDALWAKVLLRLRPMWIWPYADAVFARWLRQCGPEHCDVLLVIKGEGVSPRFLTRLRHRYPRARFILYLWDSVRNVRGTKRKFPLFDRRLSFDPHDCGEREDLLYRPLFFVSHYRLSSTAAGGDSCFFIGTLNGDRPAVIERLLRSSSNPAMLDYWLFVRSDLELRVRRLFDAGLRALSADRLLRRPMSAATIRQHYENSAAILDIEHPKQVGLTMRTFEVLAAGKKLITTNKTILREEVFDPSRVLVLDRADPRIPAEFLATPTRPMPSSFFDKYSVEGWIRDVLAAS